MYVSIKYLSKPMSSKASLSIAEQILKGSRA